MAKATKAARNLYSSHDSDVPETAKSLSVGTKIKPCMAEPLRQLNDIGNVSANLTLRQTWLSS